MEIKKVLASLITVTTLAFTTMYVHDEVLPQQYTHDYVYVIAERGDTVWNICMKYYDYQDRYTDIRDFVYNTCEYNGFFSGRKHLEEGDCIKLILDNRVSRRWNDVLCGIERRRIQT